MISHSKSVVDKKRGHFFYLHWVSFFIAETSALLHGGCGRGPCRGLDRPARLCEGAVYGVGRSGHGGPYLGEAFCQYVLLGVGG